MERMNISKSLSSSCLLSAEAGLSETFVFLNLTKDLISPEFSRRWVATCQPTFFVADNEGIFNCTYNSQTNVGFIILPHKIAGLMV